MTAFRLNIDKLEDVHRAIHVLQHTGNDHRIPILAAVLEGRIAHFEVERTGCAGRCKQFLAMTKRKPTLILVGDDDGLDTGPAQWPRAQRLLNWSAFVVLHVTGAERWHYETTVNATELVGRVLLVECGTLTLSAWMDAVKRWAPNAAVQIIEVRPGEAPHPASSDEVLQ